MKTTKYKVYLYETHSDGSTSNTNLQICGSRDHAVSVLEAEIKKTLNDIARDTTIAINEGIDVKTFYEKLSHGVLITIGQVITLNDGREWNYGIEPILVEEPDKPEEKHDIPETEATLYGDRQKGKHNKQRRN